MAETLPEDVRALLNEPNFVFLATLMKDGSPQVTPVWVDVDGDQILINTVENRQKSRNIKSDPRVALSVTDRNNAYAWASIRGRIVEMTTEGAEAHIDKMAQKYLGQARYPFRQPGEQRVILRIQPEAVTARL